MSSTPKFFTDVMAGAPQLTGVAGSLIAILDACLVNGFGLKTADSVAVAGGIATMNFSTGHSFEPHSIALVAGATPAGLNGEQRILSVTTNTATFATAAASGTATGTITAKVAPLGWTKVYSGTNKAVYKPSAVEASSALLRVDDTGTMTARVRMYESMTDIDTGVNVAPTDAKVSGGLFWWKSSTASAVTRMWTIIGDERNLYFAPAAYSSATNNVGSIHAFGDLISYKSGDAFCGCLTGDVASVSSGAQYGNAAYGATGHGTQITRSHTGIGGSISAERRPMIGATGTASGADNTLGPFPAPINNGLMLTRMLVAPSPLATFGPRGFLPGFFYVPQTGTNAGQFLRGTVVDGTGEFAGRKVYAIPQSGSAASTPSNDYAAFFDLTGPWRN